MKHKAAIHLQITMFSRLNGHHACAGWKEKKKNSREREECGTRREGQRLREMEREPRGRGE